MTNWIVCKFGGTSVATLARWQSILAICDSPIKKGLKPLLVCSAPAGVSNLLERLIKESMTQAPEEKLYAIEKIYQTLADELGVSFSLLAEDFAKLKQLCHGIHLIAEASPRVHARIMAFGELLLTKLGHAYLNQNGLTCAYQDARRCLTSVKTPNQNPQHAYLSARCQSEPDAALQKSFSELSCDLIITQGFIAQNQKGETVLLGRGGSDTSAAYFAAKLQATHCEIWTDVPGIYSANPHEIPAARHLAELNYIEAQEIAAMGAKVLHPNCLAPVKKAAIPLTIKYTGDPSHPGTRITQTGDEKAQIKAIQIQDPIYLISIESIAMWQQVGFLADVFNCFKAHGFSIDLISTSQASITVSLDANHQHYQNEAINELIEHLNQFSHAKLVGPCAAVSLVGQHIRTILPELSGVLSLFEAQQIYLMSLAANDLNFTIVVDHDQARKLARKLHHLLIEQNPAFFCVGHSWQEQFGEKKIENMPWWQVKREALLKKAKADGPCYVYSLDCVKEAAHRLKTCTAIDQIFYAVKANSNQTIWDCLEALGVNFECVSFAEVDAVMTRYPTLSPKRVLFTPNFAPRHEYALASKLPIQLTLDSLYPLKAWPELFKNREILLRIDLGTGRGHHKYVCTAGNDSKFGIPFADLPAAAALIKSNNIKVIGLHAHSGSGILQTDHWRETATKLAQLRELFPSIQCLNLGGGLGIKENPNQQALDLEEFNRLLEDVKQSVPDLAFWLEPGRYLVAESGVLLARVTQVKRKGETHFIGIETGMNSLLRPSLYGAYHEIVNLSRLGDNPTQLATVVGPICESGDTLGFSRALPECKEGDVILIANAGAYGYVMSSHYNEREPAAEFILR